MEWITGPDQNEVDIGKQTVWLQFKDVGTWTDSKSRELCYHVYQSGFIPVMKLYSTGPSIVFNDSLEVMLTIPLEEPVYNFDHFKWDKEITMEEAYRILGVTFYPFKEVDCHLGSCTFNMVLYRLRYS